MSEMTNESEYYDIPLRQPSSEDDSDSEQEIHSVTDPIDHDAVLNPKKPFKLSKSEKMDLVAALEHIVSRGHLLRKADSKCQQWAEGRQKRRQQIIIQPSEEIIPTGTLDGSVLLVPDWIQREQQQNMKESDQETGEDDGEAPRGGQKYISDRNVSSDQGERFPRLIHAEDWRIYSLNLPDGMLPNKNKNSKLGTWPRSRNKKRVKYNEDETDKEKLRTNVVDDTQWDEEQGDGIAHLDFVRDCLSSAAKHRFNSGTGAKIAPLCFNNTRGHLTPNEEDIPSLMLSRCWQRAVHAATCTIDAPHHVESGDMETRADKRSLENQTQSPGMDDHAIEDVDTLSLLKEKAIRKCEEWNIQCMLPSSSTTTLNESFECQSCRSSEFGTTQDLHCHFFGSSEARGCCWKLIEEKQIDMVHSILVKDVRFSLDGLLTVILSMVRKKKGHEKKDASTNSGEKHQSAVLNWEDVIDGLNEAVYKENQSLDGEPANVQEKTSISHDKIQVHPYLPSLDLNDDVVKAVSMRLVERYATMRY